MIKSRSPGHCSNSSVASGRRTSAHAGRGHVVIAVGTGVAQCARRESRSRPPFGDEARCGLENAGPRPERRERRLGLGDQAEQLQLRPLDPEDRDRGGLVGSRILAGRLADRLGIALDVEQVVGDLEGLADDGAEAVERLALGVLRFAEDRAGEATEASSAPVFIACNSSTSARPRRRTRPCPPPLPDCLRRQSLPGTIALTWTWVM